MGWTTIVGFILLLYAVVVILQGRITVRDSDGSHGSRGKVVSQITRSERPVLFWSIVLVILGLAAVLILNVFNF